MHDVFVSYSSSDRDRVRQLVEVLQSQGLSIWWDRQIATGSAFDRQIEDAVDDARCIMVVWSEQSVDSVWVRAEAGEGIARNILVPVKIDDVRPPLVFRQFQTADLRGWPEHRSAEGLRNVLNAVQDILKRGTESEQSATNDTAQHANDTATSAVALRGTRSIAILPFRNHSPDPENAWFAEGLWEDLHGMLAQVPDLQIAAATSSRQFDASASAGVDTDARTVAAELNVNFLIEGSVRKAGNRIRVACSLIQASNGYYLWSKHYDREFSEVLDLQDEIAARVTRALQSAFHDQELRDTTRNTTRNVDAWNEYARAMHLDREMHRGGPEALDQIRAHATRAVQLDPEFLAAYVLLANVYLDRMGFRMPKEEALMLAEEALDEALRIDPEHSGALLQKAEVLRGRQDYHGSLALYRRARDAAPDDLHLDLATTLFTVGLLDEAIAEFRRCIERDPDNFSVYYYAAATLHARGETQAAIQYFEQSLQIVGNGFLADGVRSTLAGVLYLSGDPIRAAEVLEPCLKPNPQRIDFEQGVIVCIQAMLGDAAPAQKLAAAFREKVRTEHVDAQALLWAHIWLPDLDETFHWLRRVVEEDAFPTIYFLRSWRMMDHLRADPRYDALLEEAGLTRDYSD